MEFRPNISPKDVIKKGAFGGTYFRDIYSEVNNKWYKYSWKEFEEIKDIEKKYYLSDCNWIRTHNHLVHKRTLNHLAKLGTIECGFTLERVRDMIRTYS